MSEKKYFALFDNETKEFLGVNHCTRKQQIVRQQNSSGIIAIEIPDGQVEKQENELIKNSYDFKYVNEFEVEVTPTADLATRKNQALQNIRNKKKDFINAGMDFYTNNNIYTFDCSADSVKSFVSNRDAKKRSTGISGKPEKVSFGSHADSFSSKYYVLMKSAEYYYFVNTLYEYYRKVQNVTWMKRQEIKQAKTLDELEQISLDIDFLEAVEKVPAYHKGTLDTILNSSFFAKLTSFTFIKRVNQGMENQDISKENNIP